MAKFRVMTNADLTKEIPNWAEQNMQTVSSPMDMEVLAKMFEILDNYAEQNGMQFFQVHRRRVDDNSVVVFKLKG